MFQILPGGRCLLVPAVLLQKNFAPGQGFDYLKKVPQGFARGGCWRLELTDALVSDPPPFTLINDCSLEEGGGGGGDKNNNFLTN